MFNLFRIFNCYPRYYKSCGCKKCTREINTNEITYEELLEKVKNGAVLIDVRTKQEFFERHLNSAILIPYYDIASKISRVIYDKDKTIIVYCQNGGRSTTAYKELKKLGYNNVFNLKGGVDEI